MYRLFIAVGVLLVPSCGCGLLKSRYAMDDPIYAEKYADGAPRWDLPDKVKQAVDARHTEGLGGLYVSGGAQTRPASGMAIAGGEVGGEFYTTSWLTQRAALAGYVGKDDGLGAIDLGIRVQVPARLAPFAGVGTFHGISRRLKLADLDGVDNDDDGFTDEAGENESGVDDWLSAVYPEAGVHLWINGRWRATAFSRYLVTSEGRASDEWLVGSQVAFFAR